ncbi:hypothetical protein TSOC_011963 [Tetrabaena socialis]|uniref:TIR domain-containing protein n=1 Tax=Tetrabaena socialis TaxID=47790 RepID=A0A2J7ZPA2_9CHLO|nr:hypothetical protein TSOC_011963 [Tetrabaena socialis]|eukprot:PNH02090.1 hypothetical protein TSOC_011963 [Tetrabaena socialis]
MGCGCSTPTPSPPQQSTADGGMGPAQPLQPVVAQIMLSYRANDTGPERLGGNGMTLRIMQWLESRGYTASVAETSLEGGSLWSRSIQRAILGCQVFIAVCSRGYGGTSWTLREYQLAHSMDKAILPLWHSGPYPPQELEIYMVGLQRLPKGNKPLVEMDFNVAMQEVLEHLNRIGCWPGAQQQELAELQAEASTAASSNT